MIWLSRIAPVLAIAAFIVSVLAAAAVGIDRVSTWSLVEGAGRQSAAPDSPFDPDLSPRVQFPRHPGAAGKHGNEMISLTYNWDWDATTGWTRHDLDKPSVALTVESWFNGLAELNFDMRPPRAATAWPGGRALGLAARHDGTYATLSVGGPPFNPTGSGLKITTGASLEPILKLTEGESPPDTLLRVVGRDGQARVALQGGSIPGLAFGLSGTSAEALKTGVLRVAGSPGSEPVIHVVGAGSDAVLLESRPRDDAPGHGFRLGSDGRMEWRTGDAVAVALSGAAGRLDAQAMLTATSLRVGETGTPIRGLRIIAADLDPAPIPPHASGEQTFPVPSLVEGTLVFLNAPAQPSGIGISGARAAKGDAIAVTFVNAASIALRPAPGRYLILALEPSEE